MRTREFGASGSAQTQYSARDHRVSLFVLICVDVFSLCTDFQRPDHCDTIGPEFNEPHGDTARRWIMAGDDRIVFGRYRIHDHTGGCRREGSAKEYCIRRCPTLQWPVEYGNEVSRERLSLVQPSRRRSLLICSIVCFCIQRLLLR